MQKNIVNIYTDGSSLGNPGPGGWAFVAYEHDDKEEIVTEHAGNDIMTTNNKMEMTAVIQGLKYTINKYGKDVEVHVHSDSTYVILGITNWIHGWEKNNWKNSQKKEVLNRELWEEMIALVRTFVKHPKFVKVKGHSGMLENERADLLCTTYATGEKIPLFSGSKEKYKNILHNL